MKEGKGAEKKLKPDYHVTVRHSHRTGLIASLRRRLAPVRTKMDLGGRAVRTKVSISDPLWGQPQSVFSGVLLHTLLHLFVPSPSYLSRARFSGHTEPFGTSRRPTSKSFPHVISVLAPIRPEGGTIGVSNDRDHRCPVSHVDYWLKAHSYTG
jgi:hypothetical protein